MAYPKRGLAAEKDDWIVALPVVGLLVLHPKSLLYLVGHQIHHYHQTLIVFELFLVAVKAQALDEVLVVTKVVSHYFYHYQ